MEKHKVCKICNKRYSNGKALGGHMRSHLIKLPLPLTKPNSNSNSTNSKCSPPSSSSSLDLKYGKIINTPNRSQEFSRRHHDESETETETESESDQYYLQKQYSTRRRSKRRRKSSTTTTTVSEPSFDQQVSKYCSESAGAISVEDAAMFLMKLSRDKWEKHEKELEVEVEDDDDDDDGDQEEEISIRSLSNKNSMSKYRCKLCNKEFGSYHALGGHKANHKKIKNTVDELEYENDDDDEEEEEFVQQYSNNHNLVDEVETRRFQCPFCYKVFRSGQALGGHKKVHFSTNIPFVAKLSSPKFSDNNLFIDLNLPAVADDES